MDFNRHHQLQVVFVYFQCIFRHKINKSHKLSKIALPKKIALNLIISSTYLITGIAFSGPVETKWAVETKSEGDTKGAKRTPMCESNLLSVPAFICSNYAEATISVPAGQAEDRPSFVTKRRCRTVHGRLRRISSCQETPNSELMIAFIETSIS